MAIEIVNIGPVWLKSGVWHDYVGKIWHPEDVIPTVDRGAGGCVRFPPSQMLSVVSLVDYLLTKWKIPRQIPKDHTAYQLPAMNVFKGITTHQMFRRDKYDMGTAFPFGQLVEACKLKEV